MEYVIRLDDAPADLAAIERQLLDLDPAALLDRDAIERLPSVCCGGCSG